MQPLSKVVTNPSVVSGDLDTMTMRPRVAIKIAQCIAAWSEVEKSLGLFLSFLLEAHSGAAIAMYSGVENRAAQLRMIESASKEILPPDHNNVVEAIMLGTVRPVMRERDRLAHWCWGHSERLPDALLLIEPSSNLDQHLHIFGRHTKSLKLTLDHIYVVTEKDLERTFARIVRALGTIDKLSQTVNNRLSEPERAEYLLKLSSEPHVQEALTRLRKGKGSPASPAQSPPSEQSD